MRKNRIAKYGINTQNIMLELMTICYKHLKTQIDKKEVIEL